MNNGSPPHSPTMSTTAPASALRQAFVFHRLRWHLLRNGARGVFRQSGLRAFAVGASSLLVCGVVLAFSLEGFLYLRTFGLPAAGSLIGTIFDFLFLVLMVLLLFSAGLIQ